MAHFGVMCLAALNSGAQCARQLLALWLRDVLPCLGSKAQSARQSFLVPKVRCLCSFLVAEQARCNNDNEGDSDAADKRRPR